MTAPADGVDRLIHFVDARLAQLGLSREDNDYAAADAVAG
jgi:hypothetical protein